MKTLAVIGAGKMAEAIIQGLLQKKVYTAKNIIATDVSAERLTYMSKTYGIRTSSNNLAPLREADLVLLAVKPQTITPVLEELWSSSKAEALIISIVAGTTIARIDPEHTRKVARVMPNTPALIGEAASAIAFHGPFSESEHSTVLALFQSIGTVVEVAEPQLNAVTGLSGSGPAFVFYLLSAFLEAGKALGLPEDITKQLTWQTFIGSSKLAQATDKPLAELITNVTSPNGTTWAGRQILENSAVKQKLIETIVRAKTRADELSQEK